MAEEYLIQSSTLVAIGNAIRTKKGTQANILVSQLASEILGIETGITPSGSLNITENGTVDVTNYASATVNVPIPDGYIHPGGVKQISDNNVTVNVANFAYVAVSVPKPKLYAPTVALNEKILTITKNSANGSFVTGYDLYVNGDTEPTVTLPSSTTNYNLSNLSLANNTYAITVKAKGTNFTDSDASNSVNVTIGSTPIGYTVSFQNRGYNEVLGNNQPTNCVLRVFFANSYIDVTVDENLPSSTVYNNVIGIQLMADTTSKYLYYTMSGQSSYLYHAGSGNPSAYLELTGDICIKNYTYVQECISSETLVTMADGTYKPLGQIHTGDDVLSYDWNTMQLISRKVIYSSCEEDDWNTGGWDAVRYFKNTFNDGTVIKQAFAHRFYNLENQAFTYLEAWQIGEHTYSESGDNPILISREIVYEPIRYARITLEGSTNYFANGLLTGDRHCPTELILGSDET